MSAKGGRRTEAWAKTTVNVPHQSTQNPHAQYRCKKLHWPLATCLTSTYSRLPPRNPIETKEPITPGLDLKLWNFRLLARQTVINSHQHWINTCTLFPVQIIKSPPIWAQSQSASKIHRTDLLAHFTVDLEVELRAVLALKKTDFDDFERFGPSLAPELMAKMARPSSCADWANAEFVENADDSYGMLWLWELQQSVRWTRIP